MIALVLAALFQLTVPRFAAAPGCGEDSAQVVADVVRVQIYAVPRCEAWRTWPAGWDTCGRVYLVADTLNAGGAWSERITLAGSFPWRGVWTCWAVARRPNGLPSPVCRWITRVE